MASGLVKELKRRRAILILSALLMLASVVAFYEAYESHREYQKLLDWRFIPYDMYDYYIGKVRRCELLLPIFFIGGLVLLISGVVTLFMGLREKPQS